jgi:hypothetical protein
MKSSTKVNSLIMVVASLFVFAMAAPVMADRLVTFEGMINEEGKFEADNGTTFWLYGHKADDIEQHVGRDVEITGLLRENRDTGSLGTSNMGPSIEVYSYEWDEGSYGSDKSRDDVRY